MCVDLTRSEGGRNEKKKRREVSCRCTGLTYAWIDLPIAISRERKFLDLHTHPVHLYFGSLCLPRCRGYDSHIRFSNHHPSRNEKKTWKALAFLCSAIRGGHAVSTDVSLLLFVARLFFFSSKRHALCFKKQFYSLMTRGSQERERERKQEKNKSCCLLSEWPLVLFFADQSFFSSSSSSFQ